MARRRVPPHDPPAKLGRPLEEIAASFGPQVAGDDCLVVCLGGILGEFGGRRGFDIDLGRETVKQVCGYHGTFGSTSTKVVPNLNVSFRNAKLGKELACREAQAPSTTVDQLARLCADEKASFPIVGLGAGYWKSQSHLAVRGEGVLDHTIIPLAADKEVVRFFDPYQRPAPTPGPREAVREMPTVTFLKLWQEALMAPAWVLWIAQISERPSLEAFAGGKRHG